MTPKTTHDDMPSIGKILRSRREQNNISVADIASKMHLDNRVINALEEDNFDKLPNPIYVRGYIRSYSKLVGADADALVKLYEQHGGDFEPEIIPEIKHPTQSSSSDRPVKAFTYLITLALVVLLIAWWQSNFVIDTVGLSTTADEQTQPDQPLLPEPQAYTQPQPPAYTSNDFQVIPAVTTVTNGVIDGSGTNMDTMNNNLPGTLPTTTSATTETPVSVTDTTLSTVSITTTTTLPSQSVIGAPTTEQSPGLVGLDATQPLNIDNTQSVMHPLPDQGATVSSQAPVYQTTGPDLIVLRLTADSWIEIIDASNKKVFFDLGRSGDVFNVRGTAPFDVLLGFAQAVIVEYNGNHFDAAPYSRAGVARFKLGE